MGARSTRIGGLGWKRNSVCFRKGCRFLFLILTVALSACSSMRGFPDRSEEASARLEALQRQFFLPETDVLKSYDGITGKDAKKAFRDKVIYGRMMAIDLQFSVFQKAIYEEGVGTNIVLDIMGVGVGAGGAAVTGATSSRILSALSGGISGTHTAINKNLYFDRTMPALMALMEAERQKIKTEIYRGLQLGVDDYPLGRGLVDLEHYFFAGSIPGAIASVTKTAGAKSEEAEDDLKSLTEGKFKEDEASKLLRNFWKPDGQTVNQANQQKILEWLDSHGFDAGPGAITTFLYSDWATKARVQAAKDLNLLQ